MKMDIHQGWEEIFSHLKIIEHINKNKYFDISSEQIKDISKKEPRLMAKIDFREQLPEIMKTEDMAILAIKNGLYRIGKFDPFIDIEPYSNIKPNTVLFPENILTLNPQKLSNESAVLDVALISDLLTDVFQEEVALTIRGRSRSPDFKLKFNDIDFPISGVQIEIDGGYEGSSSFNIIEAKMGMPKNINIRQLIYPQKSWEIFLGKRKKIKTFISFYQEPILRFIPIIFENDFCKADHDNEKSFRFGPNTQFNLKNIVAKPNISTPVREAPFPQADNFETILTMFTIIVREGFISKELLFKEFDLTMRQIDYYNNALKWLGLVSIEKGIVTLLPEGKKISHLTFSEKIHRLAEIIFSEPLFKHILISPEKNIPKELYEKWNIDGSTLNRRIQTIKSWINYFETFSNE